MSKKKQKKIKFAWFFIKILLIFRKNCLFFHCNTIFWVSLSKKMNFIFHFLIFCFYFLKIFLKLFIYKGIQEKKLKKLTFILKKWKIKFTFFQSNKHHSGKINIIFLVFLKWILNFLIFFLISFIYKEFKINFSKNKNKKWENEK